MTDYLGQSVNSRVSPRATFEARFGYAPWGEVRAPGRINLIGEHTDYNDGFVLPMAIDRSVQVVFGRRDDRELRLYSINFDQDAALDLDALERGHPTVWANYVAGVAWALSEVGHHLPGLDVVISGNIPIAAGLASSAALQVATVRAFCLAAEIPWDAPTMARVAQSAESNWVGVHCGIMDQLTSATARSGHALLIDCRDLTTRDVRIPKDLAIIILDTATRRELVTSSYNERADECARAARHLGVESLRDASLDDVLHALNHHDGSDRLPFLRAAHVLTENERTLSAARALEASNAGLMGQLMDQSHESLRTDFEVSSMALDVMVETARDHDACYGARMSGAGFGGCAVALVDRAGVADFAAWVTVGYRDRTGLEAAVLDCTASAGAESTSV